MSGRWPRLRWSSRCRRPRLGGSAGLKLGVAEPRRETASLAATMVIGDAMATTDADLPGLVKTLRGVVHTGSTAELLRSFGPDLNAGPASEQAVLPYDSPNPTIKLVAVHR